MMDHERSRSEYFRAREIFDGIRWEQYDKAWLAPVRYLFERLLDAPSDRQPGTLVAQYYNDVAFDLVTSSGLLDAVWSFRAILRPLGEGDGTFADVYQAATWVLLRKWPRRYIAES